MNYDLVPHPEELLDVVPYCVFSPETVHIRDYLSSPPSSEVVSGSIVCLDVCVTLKRKFQPQTNLVRRTFTLSRPSFIRKDVGPFPYSCCCCLRDFLFPSLTRVKLIESTSRFGNECGSVQEKDSKKKGK